MQTTILYEDAEQRVEQDTDDDGNVVATRTIDKLGLLANASTLYANAVTAMANMDAIITQVQAGSPTAAQLRTDLGQLAQTQKGVIRVLLRRYDAVT